MKKQIDAFNKLPLLGKVLVAVAIWFGFGFVLRTIRRIKAASEAAADAATLGAVASAYGITSARLDELKSYGYRLQIALWDWHKTFGFIPWWSKRIDEDESTVYDCLNNLQTANEARFVSKAFYDSYPSGLPESYKKSLKASIDELFSTAEKQNIKSVIYAALT